MKLEKVNTESRREHGFTEIARGFRDSVLFRDSVFIAVAVHLSLRESSFAYTPSINGCISKIQMFSPRWPTS